MINNLSCAILAGGKSSRIKGYKAIINYKDKPLILHVLMNLYDYFDEIIISVNNYNQYHLLKKLLYTFEKVKILIDPVIRLRCPLIGLYTCLIGTKYDYVFVTACDMPHVNIKIVNFLYELIKKNKYSAIVPRWPNGFIEPLCAIYNRNNTLKTLLEVISYNEYSLHALISKLVKVKYLPIELLMRRGISRNVFYNINKLSDLKK